MGAPRLPKPPPGSVSSLIPPVLLQVCDAIKSLLMYGVIHCDLAARNVLVASYANDDPEKLLVKVWLYKQMYASLQARSVHSIHVPILRHADRCATSASAKTPVGISATPGRAACPSRTAGLRRRFSTSLDSQPYLDSKPRRDLTHALTLN